MGRCGEENRRQSQLSKAAIDRQLSEAPPTNITCVMAGLVPAIDVF